MSIELWAKIPPKYGHRLIGQDIAIAMQSSQDFAVGFSRLSDRNASIKIDGVSRRFSAKTCYCMAEAVC